jgi:predicted enzyme related to lactoylglutathione lyase
MLEMHSKPLLRILPALAALAIAMPVAAHAAPFPPLNTPDSADRHPGKLVWADLFTSNPAEATTFYCSLLGWTSVQIDQKGKAYTIFSNDGRPVAGLAPHSAGKEHLGSRWIGYIAVSDMDSSVSAVTKIGGKLHAPARKFPKRGSQAIIGDLEGVPLGLLQSSSGDSADDEPNAGEWNWFEIYVSNPKAAADFYRDALGYEVSEDTRSTTKNEYLLASGGVSRGGITQAPEGKDVRPSWLGVIRVSDLDTTLQKVAGLGGEVLVAPHAVEFGSRFAIILDSTGGTVGLVQYMDSANPATSTNP